jgi:hypothetical protein
MGYEGGGGSKGSEVNAGFGEMSSCAGGFEKQKTYDVVLTTTATVVSMYVVSTVQLKTMKHSEPETVGSGVSKRCGEREKE